MPGPIIPKASTQVLPYWADPSQESVTDPLWQTLIKKAVGLSGYGDPNNAVINAAMPQVTPLISIYKNAAERAPMTQAFIDAGKKISPAFGDAAEYLAKRYPRVAAHLDLAHRPDFDPLPGGTTYGITHLPKNEHPVAERMGLTITDAGVKLGNEFPSAARNTLAHEMTHGAQRLGNRELRPLYNIANLLTGYEQNPFEIAATTRGNAAQVKIPKVDKPAIPKFDPEIGNKLAQFLRGGPAPSVELQPFTVNRALNNMADELAYEGASGHPVAQTLEDILQRRGVRGK